MKLNNNGNGNRRRTGAEFRALAWAARHPLAWFLPTLAALAVAWVGLVPVAAILGGLLLVAVVWSRAHPGSWFLHGAPILRSLRRRWTVYVGARWDRVCQACDLVRVDRRTGATLTPRITRVSSPTPTIDRLLVRLPAGQAVRAWQDSTDELRDTLRADGLAVTRHRPGLLALTIVRGNPFANVVPAVDIPAHADEVDLSRVELGDTEYGAPWCEQLLGQHWLVSGATGSGKGGLIWNPLRAIGPAIRDGLVRVWMVDPKGGMETARATPLFHRWADHVDPDDNTDEDGDPVYSGESALELVEAFRDEMKTVQRDQAATGSRKFRVSLGTPFNVLIVDELAMLTALSDRSTTNRLEKLLAEITTQGRSVGYSVLAYVQEPTKDIVAIRDLFTRRVSLRTNTDTYVDMVLGDGARARGALCDEIPAGDAHAGIGYRVDDHTRQPQRVRAGLVTDDDIDELVRLCTPRAHLAEVVDHRDDDRTGRRGVLRGHLIDFPNAS